MSDEEQHDTPSTADTRKLPANVKLLGLTSLVNDIASEMIYPLLPDLLRGIMAASYEQVALAIGVIEGIAEAISSILKLFAGSWSDRTGRRKSWIVAGYSMAAAARPLLGLVVLPWQVLACRVGDRLGKGIRTSARDAVIAESTPPAQRGWAFGFHRAMDHLGAAIGPVLATLFLWWWPDHLQTLFLLTIIPGLIVVAILVFGLREPKHAAGTAQPFIWSLAPLSGNFRLYLVSLAVFTLGNSSDLFLLSRAGQLGVREELLPIMWFTFHVAKSAGNMIVGRLVERLGARRLIVAGWAAYAAVYFGFALATEAWHAWALFMSYALFYALTEPPEKTLVAELVPGERKGLAYGWYNFAIGVAAMPASVLFGYLYKDYGALTAFSTGAALAMLAAALLLGVKTPAKEKGR
ncbi:MAG TPA: MFS transporter [Pirellulales bacterium]|nr:MFS transporter [Pirellulales bacterium]